MRRQLGLVVGAVTAMVVIAFLIPLAGAVRTLARDRALSAAERDAQTLAQALAAVLPEAGIEGARILVGAAATQSGLVSVILPDDQTIGVPTDLDANLARARAGEAFRTTTPEGEAIYVPVLLSAETTPVVVRALVLDEALTSNVATAWAVLGGLGLVLVSLSVLVADRLARSIVRPVEDLSDAAHRLSDGDLSVRVEPTGPAEVVEVARAFNLLGGRIERLLVEEREAAADLSHRLRTPLTALRLEIEAADHPAEAERLLAVVGDLEREVDRLIADARRPIREAAVPTADLGDVARQRVEFWGALAEEQERSWELNVADGRHDVPVHPDDLAAVVDALLENVIAHTPRGTGFIVSVEQSNGGAARILVEDEGPGFPSATVLARGASEAGSTGLGLDIVRRTAEATGGSVLLSERRTGGASIVVRFGPTT